MPRILPLQRKEYSSEIKISFIQHETVYNSSITNSKATLGHSAVAFKAYMQWYPLFQEVKSILGDRLATLLAWSVSKATDSHLTTSKFRKVIIESGEDPDDLTISEHEQEILNFGISIAQNHGVISDNLYDPVRQRYSDESVVVLTAFIGMMIATNIFNNVAGVEIDEYLLPYLQGNHQMA